MPAREGVEDRAEDQGHRPGQPEEPGVVRSDQQREAGTSIAAPPAAESIASAFRIALGFRTFTLIYP